MWSKEKIINGLNALYKSMHKNQCYACSYEFVEVEHEFGTEILAEAEEFIKEQPQIVRCKDCKYYIEPTEEEAGGCLIKAGYFPVSENWFCADGEKE